MAGWLYHGARHREGEVTLKPGLLRRKSFFGPARR